MSYQAIGYRRVKNPGIWSLHDIAALTDGGLLAADEGRLLLLEPKGDAYRIAWAFDRWGDEAQLARNPTGHLLELYVRFHDEAKADPASHRDLIVRLTDAG